MTTASIGIRGRRARTGGTSFAFCPLVGAKAPLTAGVQAMKWGAVGAFFSFRSNRIYAAVITVS